MKRRYYTPELANRSLPLVRAIATDIADSAKRVLAIHKRTADADSDERETALADLERAQQEYLDHVAELEDLGIEIKDPMNGLIDFRWRREGRDVYLCWRLGEDEVSHWHEVDAGFAGRRPVEREATELGSSGDGAS